MEFSPGNSSAADLAVCRLRPWDNTTCGHAYLHGAHDGVWRPFAAAGRVEYFDNQSCLPNPELGRDHVRLPVTHTRANTPSLGMWYYYARGCSDFGWNTGRTLAARNRCHAAVKIDQRVHDDGTRQAINRMASYFLRRWPSMSRHITSQPYVQMLASDVNATEHDLLTLALCACASGVYGNTTSHCLSAVPSGPDSCIGDCQVRARALAPLAGHYGFDYFMRDAMRNFTVGQDLDSVQLLQQPNGMGSLQWTTELWDVRELVRRSNHVASTTGWLNGSSCVLSSNHKFCKSCKGSRMETACNFHCDQHGHFVTTGDDTDGLIGLPVAR